MKRLPLPCLLLFAGAALAQQPGHAPRYSSQLAIWLGLGAAFLGLLTTFFSVWAAKRKKAAGSPEQPSATQRRETIDTNAATGAA